MVRAAALPNQIRVGRRCRAASPAGFQPRGAQPGIDPGPVLPDDVPEGRLPARNTALQWVVAKTPPGCVSIGLGLASDIALIIRTKL